LTAPTRSRVHTPDARTHASRHKLQLRRRATESRINSLHLAVVNAASKRHVVQAAAGDKQIDLRARTPRFAVELFNLAAFDAMLTFPAAKMHGELRCSIYDAHLRVMWFSTNDFYTATMSSSVPG